MTDDQVDALVRASGHTREDALRILTELKKIGWTLHQPAERVLHVIPSAYAVSRAEIAMRLGDDDDLDCTLADLVARGLVIRMTDGYRRVMQGRP